MATDTPDVSKWSDATADYYQGTRHALIAAGICEPGWFPEHLLPMVRKDGQPAMRGGKQKTMRKYHVHGCAVLEHRRDASGDEYWIAYIPVDEAEHRCRVAKQKEEWKQQMAESERRNRKAAEERRQEKSMAEPVVAQLRQRCPTFTHIDGAIHVTEDGSANQSITYYASPELLRAAGILTGEMMEKGGTDDSYFSGTLRNGDRFFVDKREHCVDDGDYWGLTVHTRLDAADVKRIAEMERPDDDTPCLDDLPRFVPGSMSEGERYFMRIVRALSDHSWDFLVSLAETSLAREQASNRASQAKSQFLRLVTDNTKH